jgi:hypothetical protein
LLFALVGHDEVSDQIVAPAAVAQADFYLEEATIANMRDSSAPSTHGSAAW